MNFAYFIFPVLFFAIIIAIFVGRYCFHRYHFSSCRNNICNSNHFRTQTCPTQTSQMQAYPTTFGPGYYYNSQAPSQAFSPPFASTNQFPPSNDLPPAYSAQPIYSTNTSGQAPTIQPPKYEPAFEQSTLPEQPSMNGALRNSSKLSFPTSSTPTALWYFFTYFLISEMQLSIKNV